MSLIKTLVFVFFLLLPIRVYAVSLDATGMATDGNNKQVMVNLAHIQKLPQSSMEISGRYAKTAGKPQMYEAGMSQMSCLPYRLRVESDFRYYQSHKTYSAGVGAGNGFLTLSAGARLEIADDGNETYGKITAIARTKSKSGLFALDARAEALCNVDGDRRIDCKAVLKIQKGNIYLVLRAESIRQTQLAGFGVGLKY